MRRKLGPGCCNLMLHHSRDHCDAKQRRRESVWPWVWTWDPRQGESIHIPAVMVSEDDGKRLVSMMDLESMDMGPELGVQHFDRVLNS